MIYFLLFNIAPTAVEMLVVAVIFYVKFGWEMVAATAVTVAVVHLDHPHDHRMAHQAARADERPRRPGAGARGRFAAQLRDGEVLRRREARAGALRRGHARLRRGGDQERELARPAQHRPGDDHEPDDGRGDGLHRVGLEQGAADGRRPGADPDLPDAAVPPARHARLGLPHDPPGADRHGGDVPADRHRDRGAGRARRAGAGRAPADGGVRGRGVRLRPRPRDPPRAQLRGPGGRARGDRRPLGRGQVDHRPAAVPLLRSVERAHPDRRAGHHAR